MTARNVIRNISALTAILIPATALGLPEVVEGPLEFNGHTYYLLADSNWTDAEASAMELGGHLVTISSQAEHDWVWSTFGNGGTRHLWLGFVDKTMDGNFSWSSGEATTYTNWADGEPNNADGVEYYAQMNRHPTANGKWNDLRDRAGMAYPNMGAVEVVDPCEDGPIIAGVSIVSDAICLAVQNLCPGVSYQIQRSLDLELENRQTIISVSPQEIGTIWCENFSNGWIAVFYRLHKP